MTSSATLTWFARHELTLAWRDWSQMMAGGKSARERAVTAGLLVFVVLIVGGLTFLPSLVLGPGADHFAMISGQLF